MLGRMRCIGSALLVVIAMAATAQGQRGQRRSSYSSGPDYWIGLSYGLQDGIDLTDGNTNTTWDFGYTSQIRASLEKRLQGGVSLGLAAAFATAPLTYGSTLPTPGTICTGSCACSTPCTAHANISQYLVTVRTGGDGPGLHNGFLLEGGVTQFADFRDRETNATLPPTNASYDPTFSIGYGLSYGLSSTSEIFGSETLGTVLHSQGSSAVQSTPPRIYTTSIGLRIGF